MKTPSQIIRERIELVDTSPYFASDKKGILEVLQFILPLIEEYEASSVERLLEEMCKSSPNMIVSVSLKDNWEWASNSMTFHGGFMRGWKFSDWTTPQEALQKLKAKLNNQ